MVIVNHHLFFADLAVKQAAEDAPDAGVLPEAGVVIFDEAHELEDVASSYFGISVSDLAGARPAARRRADGAAAQALRLRRWWRRRPESTSAAQLFFSALPPGEGRFEFQNRGEFLEENGDEFLSLQAALAQLALALQGLPTSLTRSSGWAAAPKNCACNSAFCWRRPTATRFSGSRGGRPRDGRASGAGRARAQHAARGGRQQHVFLQATPIDVSQILRQTLFEQVDTAVLTSATLAVNGTFDYIRERLGIRTPANWWLPRTSIMRARPCCTFRRICPIRASRALPSAPPPAYGRCWRSRAAGLSASSPATRR